VTSIELRHAIHTGNLAATRVAVCLGAPLADVVHPPLLDAVASGNPDMVRLLIDAGAPPLAFAARQAAQAFVEQALNNPELPESGPGSGDAFLECLDLADALGAHSMTTIRQRRRAFVLQFHHQPGMRLSKAHRIVESVTGMKASMPTVSSDLRRAGLR